MKVLFIGGTGIISSACSKLAIENGIDLYHLNRGKSILKRKVDGVKTFFADFRDLQATKKALEDHSFDAVVDWIAFTPEHIEQDIALFKDKTKQFVFISSASVYQKPPQKLPITEETPLGNIYWEYSRIKIACENLLRDEYKKSNFPYTIVRPSHTYDKTLIPMIGSYTTLHRMKAGLPVIIHGDGTSVWPLTHHKEFAVGLIGLLGKQEAINEAFHITTDELITWNDIFNAFAAAIDVKPNYVYIPSSVIIKHDPSLTGNLLGDKAQSMIFDNSKIRNLVPEFNPVIPFKEGAVEIAKWYDEDKSRQIVDEKFNLFTERLIREYHNN